MRNTVQVKRDIVLATSLAFALAMVMTGKVFAQTAEPTRYPWDNRPSACFQPTNAKETNCKLDNWPNFEETVQRVTLLYSTEQFVLLEKAMHEIVSSKKRFADGDSPATGAYWAFRRLMPAPGTNPGHADKIARWQNAVPTSYFMPFAHARFTYGSAWNLRGSDYAGSVSKESWELFNIRLREAEKILLDAPAASQDTPLWHNLLLAITLDTSQTNHKPDEVFKEAVRRWPNYFDFYELRLTRLVPRWGGSWEGVDVFINHWTDHMAASEGSSLYARLYLSLRNQVTPNETAMNWTKMKKSFKDLVTRYPSVTFKNLFASYACLARDKDAFNTAVRNISSHELAPNQWLSGHSYEACMRWSAV